MQAVKMYTTAVCPYCIRAKQMLKSKAWNRSRKSVSIPILPHAPT